MSAPLEGSFYCEDVAGLLENPTPEIERHLVPGVSPGFKTLRQKAEGIAIGIVIEDGSVFWGDAMGVSYAGKAGRRRPFSYEEGLEQLKALAPRLEGYTLGSLREFFTENDFDEMSPAFSYGLSQALLYALAHWNRISPVEVFCKEWKLPFVAQKIAIQGSCGNDRTGGAIKMIAARLEALPHTQVDNVREQVGEKGEVLKSYVSWLRDKVFALEASNYQPTIHLDVHGALGKVFPTLEALSDYLLILEKIVAPLPLRIESAVLSETRECQILAYSALTRRLQEKGSRVKLVADEWANCKEDIIRFAESHCVSMIHLKMPDIGSVASTMDALLVCQNLGVETLLGGSCIETENSAKLSVHLAMAGRPTVYLAKPGMGVNEAISLTRNEMEKILALAPSENSPGGP